MIPKDKQKVIAKGVLIAHYNDTYWFWQYIHGVDKNFIVGQNSKINIQKNLETLLDYDVYLH